MKKIITVDGPAASGKTSVSRELARKLGFNWISTGAFYRGLGYAALNLGVDIQNEKELAKLVRDPRWEVRMSEEFSQVFFNGTDVTSQIASDQVGALSSKISAYPLVREALLGAQRDTLKQAQKGLVAEGRDCGTVVFPQAHTKIFLTARAENRAARRAQELGANVYEVQKSQTIRDHQDSTRKIAPMAQARDAHVIDTSLLNLDEVIHEAIRIYQQNAGVVQQGQ